MIQDLNPETLEAVKKIKHDCLDLMLQLTQAKSKQSLLEAGKALSAINYSLLYILKQHEMEAVNMIDESNEE